MSAKQSLIELLDRLPDDRVEEVLNFARQITDEAERSEWSHFGAERFAQAYGPDEPVYTLDDLKPDGEQ